MQRHAPLLVFKYSEFSAEGSRQVLPSSTIAIPTIENTIALTLQIDPYNYTHKPPNSPSKQERPRISACEPRLLQDDYRTLSAHYICNSIGNSFSTRMATYRGIRCETAIRLSKSHASQHFDYPRRILHSNRYGHAAHKLPASPAYLGH